MLESHQSQTKRTSGSWVLLLGEMQVVQAYCLMQKNSDQGIHLRWRSCYHPRRKVAGEVGQCVATHNPFLAGEEGMDTGYMVLSRDAPGFHRRDLGKMVPGTDVEIRGRTADTLASDAWLDAAHVLCTALDTRMYRE